MKILLINPWIYDVASFDYWLKPLGLLLLARELAQSSHELRLIDCLDRYDPELIEFTGKQPKTKWNGTGKFFYETVQKPIHIAHVPRFFKRYGMPKALFEKKLMRLRDSGFNPDYVFITSAMTYWYPGPFEAIETVRKLLKESVIILGGNYANLMPEHSKKSGADLVCNYSKMKDVLSFLNQNSITIKGGNEKQNLIPYYDLYNHDMSHLVFMTSLGCPYSCSYCATPFLQDFIQEDQIKTVDALERYSQRFNVKNIAFFDDAILINHEKHFDVILKEIIKRGLPERGLIFHIPNGIHARLLTPVTAELMKRANVKTIKVALETTDTQLQIKTGGKVSTDDFYRAIKILKEAGFSNKELAVFILINLPEQKFAEAIEIHDICKSLDILPEINEYTPIPGTRGFKEVFNRSTLPDDFDPLQLNNTILSFSWKEGLSIDEIELIKNYNKKIVQEIKNGGSCHEKKDH